MLSIVQLSRFFLCSFSSDSFYILSKALSFVKNFFNFFHFLFCGAFSQRVSSPIIPFRFIFVNCFFTIFSNFFDLFFSSLQVLYYVFSHPLMQNTIKRTKLPSIWKLFEITLNGERGIWTLAPVSRPTPLAGAPLQPLEYFSWFWIIPAFYISAGQYTIMHPTVQKLLY